MIIGLTGRKQVGKDTIGEMLVHDFGFLRLAFGDELKRRALLSNPLVPITDDCPGCQGYARQASGSQRQPTHFVYLRRLVDQHGWDDAKERFPGVRALLQSTGDQIRAQEPDLLVRTVLDQIEMADLAASRVVVTDVRFPTEAQALSDLGGYLVRVVRPGNAVSGPIPSPDDPDPLTQHASETNSDFIDVNQILVNDSDLDVLRTRAVRLVERATRAQAQVSADGGPR